MVLILGSNVSTTISIIASAAEELTQGSLRGNRIGWLPRAGKSMMNVCHSSPGSSTRGARVQRSPRETTPQTVQSVDAFISSCKHAVLSREPPGDTARHKTMIKMVESKTGQWENVRLTGHGTTEDRTKRRGARTQTESRGHHPLAATKPKEGANPLFGDLSRTRQTKPTFTPSAALATTLIGMGEYALLSNFPPFFKNRFLRLDF